MVECLPGICEALGSTPSTERTNNNKKIEEQVRPTAQGTEIRTKLNKIAYGRVMKTNQQTQKLGL